MITVTPDIVTVVFSKCDLGQITMSIEKTRLLIQEVVGEIEEMGPTSNDNIKEYPKIILEFYKLKSVDMLISQLIAIRKNLKANTESAKLRAIVENLQKENEVLRKKNREQ
jgi:hypothetical protein